MSDNNSNTNTAVNQTIPSFVGQYRRKSDEKIPKIVVIDSELQLTKAEKRVCDFYKCSVNWDQSEDNRPVDTNEKQRCFAVRQTTLYFEMHLKDKHSSVEQFFCFYCFYSKKLVLKRYPYTYLIKHMLKRHRFRRFQCNLCAYRAITEEHVILHQKTEHPSEYSKAMESTENSIDCSGSHSSHETKEKKREKICQIFVCPKITDETRDLFTYWNKYKDRRLNSEGMNETYFQCLYCTFMEEKLPKVISHCAEKHQDYPLLYYIPEPQISSSTVVELVHDFMLNTQLNTYDDIPKVRPKLEPQDDIVSSTQKSPPTATPTISQINDNSERRRRLSTDDNQSGAKRLRVSSNESVDQNQPNHSRSLMAEELRVQIETICLFCEQTFTDSDIAKNHMKSHFNNSIDQNVLEWINQFVKKQWRLCSFDSSDASNSSKICYNCPLCLKLAKIHNRIAKKFKTFIEVRNHFFQHCSWLPVKCKVCQSSISNCDPIITKHFNDDRIHNSVLKLRKFQFLLSEESDITFNSEQRSLLENKCIEVKRYSVIDKTIDKILVQIKEDFEKQLRIKNNCDKRFVKPVLKRLSLKDFAKHYMEFEKYENKTKEIEERREESDKMDKQNKKLTKNPNKTKETSVHKSANDSSDSNESTGRVDPINNCLEAVDSIQRILTEETPQTSAHSSYNVVEPRNRLYSSESREMEAIRDSDTDLSLNEEFARISCYHCTDKFKTKHDYRVHSATKHPNLPQRMYVKPPPK